MTTFGFSAFQGGGFYAGDPARPNRGVIPRLGNTLGAASEHVGALPGVFPRRSLAAGALDTELVAAPVSHRRSALGLDRLLASRFAGVLPPRLKGGWRHRLFVALQGRSALGSALGVGPVGFQVFAILRDALRLDGGIVPSFGKGSDGPRHSFRRLLLGRLAALFVSARGVDSGQCSKMPRSRLRLVDGPRRRVADPVDPLWIGGHLSHGIADLFLESSICPSGTAGGGDARQDFRVPKQIGVWTSSAMRDVTQNATSVAAYAAISYDRLTFRIRSGIAALVSSKDFNFGIDASSNVIPQACVHQNVVVPARRSRGPKMLEWALRRSYADVKWLSDILVSGPLFYQRVKNRGHDWVLSGCTNFLAKLKPIHNLFGGETQENWRTAEYALSPCN